MIVSLKLVILFHERKPLKSVSFILNFLSWIKIFLSGTFKFFLIVLYAYLETFLSINESSQFIRLS